jgi:hypothetical protein
LILLIDNYDSFTYNLVHLFQELGAEVVVRRNDEIDADAAERLAPSHLVVSPGPGRPGSSGATVEIVRHRLERYGAGRCMDFDTAEPGVIAAAIAEEIGRSVDYRPVETDGGARAAALIAELL